MGPAAPAAPAARRGRRELLLLAAAATLTGTLGFVAFPEWDLWPLAWVALLPLRWALLRSDCGPRRAAFAGAWAGLVLNLGGFFWVSHVLTVFGGLPWVVAWPICLLLCAYQGSVLALWAGAATWVGRRRPDLPGPLVDATLLVAAEQLVPFLFPWLLGHSQHRWIDLIQIVEVTGVQGLSLLLALSACTLAALLARPRQLRHWATGGAALLLVGTLALVWGHHRRLAVDAAAAAAPHLKVAIVEGDVGIRDKGARQRVKANVARYQRLSALAARAGAELVVWPETAYDLSWIPLDTERIPPSAAPLWPDSAWDAIPAVGTHLRLEAPPPAPEPRRDAAARVPGRDRGPPQRGFRLPLLLGAVTWEPDPAPPAPGPLWSRLHYNSALLLDADGWLAGRVQHKSRLLLFGEYLPFGRRFPGLYELSPRTSRFTAGRAANVLTLSNTPAGELRVAPLICYEAILPRFARRFAAGRPNLLVSQTNDAWFGPRGEPWLHLALTVFRAVEHRASLVRATNTGVSAFIDPTGRVRSHTALDAAEVLVRSVPLLGERTPFVRWGEAFAWSMVACAAVLLLLARLRPR